MSNITKYTSLAAILLMPCLVYGADLSTNVSVQVVPPGSTPPVPAQAAVAGFTTLATNQDFAQSSGIDISCDNTDGHFWYTNFNGLIQATCNGITWPASDSGNTALHIQWKPDNYGSQRARVGLASSNQFSTTSHHFPINAYYEAVVRHPTVTQLGPWYNAWAWADPNFGCCNEFDLYEIHGSTATTSSSYLNGGGIINWNCMPWTATCYWGGGLAGYVNYDTTQYHKYGLLTYQTSPTNLRTCGFLDDVPQPCGNTFLDGNQATQRNVLLLDATVGTNYSCEGSFDAINLPIGGVGSNGAGGTRVTLQGGFGCNQGNGAYVKISGTNTSADGNFSQSPIDDPLVCGGNCRFDIYDVNTGNPVPFSGTYSGAGTYNRTTSVDMWVKSFRVWSCASWQTTECDPS